MLAAKARAEVEARAREENALLVKAKEEAEARAKLEAAERLRREADIVKREAEAARRETALRKQLADAPRAKLPVVPVLIAVFAVAVVAVGAWYQYTSSRAAQIAELTALLETATRASQQLDDARRQREASLRELGVARTREEEARKSGDLGKLKEAQDAARRAETEAAKQADLVKQREAEAKKAEDAAKVAETKKQTDVAKAAADKIAMEKAAAEKAAAEKAAADKAVADKAAAERLAAEQAATQKAAADRAATGKAEKGAAQRPAARPVASIPRMPSVGDRWVYEWRVPQRSEKEEVVVEVLAVSSSSVRELSTPAGRAAIEVTHRPGPYVVGGQLSGTVMFSPYLLAFQALSEGQGWANVEYDRTVFCGECTFSARVFGEERVTVRAGTFDTWKVVLEANYRAGAGSEIREDVFWFADRAGRYVKHQGRWKAGAAPLVKMDAELLSYSPVAASASSSQSPAARASKACSGPFVAFKFSDGSLGCLDEYPVLHHLVRQATSSSRGMEPFVMAATMDLNRCPLRAFYGQGEWESGSYISSRCAQAILKESFSPGLLAGCVCEVVFDSREAVDKQVFLDKVRAMEAACRKDHNRFSEVCR